MSIKAMKQALDLLKTSWGCGDQETADRWNETMEVLCEAIKQEKKREWVGFTQEELAWLNEALNLGGRFAVIEAIEAKLKEKNS